MDNSLESQRALDHAFTEHSEAHITLLHVIKTGGVGFGPEESVPTFTEQWYETEKKKAEEMLTPARDFCEKQTGVTPTEEMTVGDPATQIVEYAEMNDIDHIVMGSHGRSGLTRILVGSVAEVVVRRAPVPVTVVH